MQGIGDADRGGVEPGRTKARPALGFLDGLRGVAAVYVVAGHMLMALQYFGPPDPVPQTLLRVLGIFNIGKLAVDIFIVLSGFCLVIPVVRNGYTLEGGVWGYIKRRALRILPPYYAAVALTLAGHYIAHATGFMEPGSRDLRLDSVVAHIFLVHNLSEQWVHSINPPLWSVAVEWQIYFLLPLVFVPVLRRFGLIAVVAVGFFLGLAPHFFLMGFLDWSYPWFVGLFALGVAGGELAFGTRRGLARFRQRQLLLAICVATGVGVIGYCLTHSGWYSRHEWVADPLLGLATASFLVFASLEVQAGRTPWLVRVLESSWASRLGGISYSIYLIHYPLLLWFWTWIVSLSPGRFTLVTLLFGFGMPMILVVSHVFSVAFERPFLSHRRRRGVTA